MLAHYILQLSFFQTIFDLKHFKFLLLHIFFNCNCLFGQFLELFRLSISRILKLSSLLTQNICSFLDIFLMFLKELFLTFLPFLLTYFLLSFFLFFFFHFLFNFLLFVLIDLQLIITYILFSFLLFSPLLLSLLGLLFLLYLLFQRLLLPQFCQVLL